MKKVAGLLYLLFLFPFFLLTVVLPQINKLFPLNTIFHTQVHAQTGPQISNISDNRNDYPNQEIPKYEKYEITFDVNTNAGNLQFPYDSNPPLGVDTSLARYSGITVNAVFEDPQGAQHQQPAFYYQDFEKDPAQPYEIPKKSVQDWLYPTSNFSWKVRFAPHQEGVWQYKLTAQDASGAVETQPQSFIVTSSASHGFIRVSPSDSRYFEFDNGDYFPGLGYNENYRGIDWVNPVQANQAKLQTMGQNGIQYTRIWLSEWSVYGAEWNPWKAHVGNGYLQNSSLSYQEAAPDSEISMRISATYNKCMLMGWERAAPPVKRNTNYRIQIRHKNVGLVGPVDVTNPWGLVVKQGGWLWSDTDPSLQCDKPGTGTVLSSYSNLNSDSWQILTSTFNSGNQDFISKFYIATENVSDGIAYIDQVLVQEDFGDGTFGPNIIEKPSMDHHLYFDQRQSYAFDKVLEMSHDNGVYLRPVIHEKNDWIFDRIHFDGGWNDGTSCPSGYLWQPFDSTLRCPHNNFFYGDQRNQDTKITWLEKAWWRYLQARWGYSPNIHSWELLNEGDPDPNHVNHFVMTDEFGKYMHCSVFGITVGSGDSQKCNFDHPNSHPISTSNWHSFPTSLWNNPIYPNIDFADYHNYINQNSPAQFYDAAWWNYYVSSIYGATPTNVGKPVIRGESGFQDAATGTWNPELVNDTQGIWVHNFVWASINPFAFYDAGDWYPDRYIYTGQFDHRTQYKPYFDFIKDVPLSSGNYVSAEALPSNLNLRAWGQKDLVNKGLHLWIQNKNHTWKNVVDGVVITPESATVTVAGFNPGDSFQVEWWDSYLGQISSTETKTVDALGELSFQIDSLTTDLALRVLPQAGIKGDVDGDGDVDGADAIEVLTNWLTADLQSDVSGDGKVNGVDFGWVVKNWSL